MLICPYSPKGESMKSLIALFIVVALQLHCGSVAASENIGRPREASPYNCPYGLEIHSKKDKRELKDIIIRSISFSSKENDGVFIIITVYEPLRCFINCDQYQTSGR